MDDPDLRVADMRWREGGSGRALYERGHIPGAVFLDWATDLIDPEAAVAFMLAPPERFASAMERVGIGDDTMVVAYADELGSGPFRLWWACRIYGHENVAVLDGGLEKWMAEGRPVTSEAPAPRPATWIPRRGAPLGCGTDEIAAAAEEPGAVVLDARPVEMFRGQAVWTETESVPAGADGVARTPGGDVRAGRIPWAKHLPVEEIYRDDRTMKSPEELRRLLAPLGVSPGSRAITYCSVGIAASALLFALGRAGLADVTMYDAGWEEWGRDPERPVARG